MAVDINSIGLSMEYVIRHRNAPKTPQDTAREMLSFKDKCELDIKLQIAAQDGKAAEVLRLIKAGADVNACDRYDDRTTALMGAASRGFTGICNILIENDADIEARDREDNTAIMIARSSNQKETAAFLSFALFAAMLFADKKTPDLFYSAFNACVG